MVVSVLGAGMILSWGSSFYLVAVLASPIAADTGWPLSWIVGALSIGFVTSGLVSPRVGEVIERRGGRPVLAAGAVFMALGLFGLTLAPSLPFYVLAWIVLGVGMGAGLYGPAMATLGWLYGADARHSITVLTLLGGLASTACWPVGAYLVETIGWRGTCASFAFLDLVVLLPLYLFGIPREPQEAAGSSSHIETAAPDADRHDLLSPERRRILLTLVTTSLTLSSGIVSAVGVHRLTVLQARGIAVGAAVALGTLVGPSQGAARVLEMLIGTRFHPVWTMIASSTLGMAGLALLFGDVRFAAIGLVTYGGGVGLASIVRGTLPLALFGPEGYATIMGRLGRPILIAFAAAPFVASVIFDQFGATSLLFALLVVAAVNVMVSMALMLLGRSNGQMPNRAMPRS